MKYLNYILWGIGAYGIYGIAWGIEHNRLSDIAIGLFLVFIAIAPKIKSTISDFTSSRAQDDLLKLKSLLDQNVITQKEFDKKATKLKERI